MKEIPFVTKLQKFYT